MRIGHGAQRDEGNALFARITRRAMGFHIHGDGAGGLVQMRLDAVAADHFVDAGDGADPRIGNLARQALEPAGVGWVNIVGDDGVGENDVAAYMAGRDAAGDAEAHHGVDGSGALEQVVGSLGGAAADDGQGGGCGSSFLLEADDKGDTWGHGNLRTPSAFTKL